MLSMSSPSGFDSDSIHSILTTTPSKESPRLSSDMGLLNQDEFPFKSEPAYMMDEFHGEGHQTGIKNHYQNDHNLSSFVFSPKERSSSTQSMFILGNFAPSYSSADMYPMYQSTHAPRRHSTIDSINGGSGDPEYGSSFGLSLPSSPSSAVDVDFENKFAQMNHFENSSIYHNSFSSKGSHFSDMGSPNQDMFQSFHSIKPNGQVPFYSESNSLLSLPKKISLYKTELCRTFEETGFCRYGVKCQFAHDKSELRIILRHPRYKTEICRTFWELGNCPYGKRCCFIHLEAGTLMNGKPPGQAKIESDNQFNGPVHHGFQKDLLVKSNVDSASGPHFFESLEHLVNPTTNHNLSLLSNSAVSSASSSPPSISSAGDATFAVPVGFGFDWMRTRRSQSLSFPSSSSSSREFKGFPSHPTTPYSASSANCSLESSKTFDIYAYDRSVSVVESNDYLCEHCSKQESGDFKAKFASNSLSCKISVFDADKSGHSCNINGEEESTESIIADSLLASLPDY